ncbi:unnamed protein product [Acanthocheilonema viteae]|uniref:Uncharacterized protein n=1 Tax=Acanthocheilonema viteae TaxID=6277 RepID=A0A498ST14_ACAVI|nr:unnamed protein product [Acanthocheilonema viteae]
MNPLDVFLDLDLIEQKKQGQLQNAAFNPKTVSTNPIIASYSLRSNFMRTLTNQTQSPRTQPSTVTPQPSAVRDSSKSTCRQDYFHLIRTFHLFLLHPFLSEAVNTISPLLVPDECDIRRLLLSVENKTRNSVPQPSRPQKSSQTLPKATATSVDNAISVTERKEDIVDEDMGANILVQDESLGMGNNIAIDMKELMLEDEKDVMDNMKKDKDDNEDSEADSNSTVNSARLVKEEDEYIINENMVENEHYDLERALGRLLNIINLRDVKLDESIVLTCAGISYAEIVGK